MVRHQTLNLATVGSIPTLPDFSCCDVSSTGRAPDCDSGDGVRVSESPHLFPPGLLVPVLLALVAHLLASTLPLTATHDILPCWNLPVNLSRGLLV